MIDTATIIVAEDCSDDLELLKRAFHYAGLKNPVQYASDGKEVIEFLESDHQRSAPETSCPLLMLLDLNMPVCTGFAVLDWLRQHPHWRQLPIIVLSDSNKQSDIERSFRLGAHGYWVKPSRFEDLVKMMVNLKELITKVARKVDLELPVPAPA